MKDIFEAIYYKIPPHSQEIPITFCSMRKGQSLGPAFAELENHPADYFVDYNEIVDNLEEEHLKRDVFTTKKIEDKNAHGGNTESNLLGKRLKQEECKEPEKAH